MKTDEYNKLVVTLVKLLEAKTNSFKINVSELECKGKKSDIDEAIESILKISIIREEIGLWTSTLLGPDIQFMLVQDQQKYRNHLHRI